MTTELMQIAREWLAFSLVLAVQLLLVLALRNPVRARLGAVACYRLWLLPLLWLPFYALGPALLEMLATSPAVTTQASGTYHAVLQQIRDFELLPMNVDASGTPALSAGGGSAIHGWTLLALLWACGTVALLAWHGYRWLNFSRHVGALAVRMSAADRHSAGTTLHFPEIRVLRLGGMTSAAIFGVFKPALLLPGTFCERYDSTQRHIILAHEAVHLRRGDNGWNLCALLLLALFWTNPLTLIAWRYFRLDQELSCDALALNACNREQRKRYARTLLDSLGMAPARMPSPVLSAWDQLSDIKERSMMVKQHLRRPARPFTMLFSLLALTVVGASLTATFAEIVGSPTEIAEPAMQAQLEPPAVQALQQASRDLQQASGQARQSARETARAADAVVKAAQALELSTQQTWLDAQHITQELQLTILDSAQAAQQSQKTAQETGQAADEVKQAALAAARVTQEVQQVASVTLQAAQITTQAAEDTAQAAEEVQQAAVETRLVTYEVRQAAMETRQAVHEAQQAALDARRVVQELQRAAQERSLVPPAVQEAQQQERAPRQRRGVISYSSTKELRDHSIDFQTASVLSEAVELLDKDEFAEARSRLGTLRVNHLSNFERSRYEQLMYNLDLNDRNYAGARAHLEAAIASRGLNRRELSRTRYQVAQLYVKEKKYAEAAALLEDWIAAESQPSSAAYYLLASSYYYQSLFDKALPVAEKAVELAEAPTEARLSLLASLYIEQQQFVAAASVVTNMVELYPGNEVYKTQLEGLHALIAQL